MGAKQPHPAAASRFKDEMLARTKTAREAAGLSQQKLADKLFLKQDTYKQYETRSLLPHYLITRFCEETKIDEAWLLSGRGKGPKRSKVVRAVSKSVA